MWFSSTLKYLAYLYQAITNVGFAIYPTKRFDGRKKRSEEGGS